MQKLLLFFLLLAGIFYLRRWFQREESSAREPRQEARRQQADRVETMRECHLCGVLVPESEAVVVAGEHFCCDAHAREFGAGGACS